MNDPATTILIVEDERIIARDIRQTLEELGYQVSAIASTADEAVAAASERCPDLVLMDVRIKGKLDGIETASILKRRFSVPVVFLTAHADDATLGRATLTEPHGYLVKPVTATELRSAIAIALYRHDIEKRLRERERWFATTLHSIADAVIAVDLAGNVSFMNRTAEVLTGTSAAAALGKPVRAALHLMDVDESPVEVALREGKTIEMREGRLLDPTTGTIRIVSDSAAPVMDDAERLGAVMIFRDVTENRTLRHRLELADRLASLGTMAAGVAHEINNPLAVIVGNIEHLASEIRLLRSDIAPPAHVPIEIGQRLDGLTGAIDDVLSGARRIARIVADLKAFSRPQEPSAGQTDLPRSIDWALRATSRMLHERARVLTEIGPVPPVAIDETRLGQVLVNLLANAAQAIPPGQPERHTVTVTARAGPPDRVVVEVRDTGVGIPEEHLGRIFEPFFTTKAVGHGTGLGLSICHGIAASVGGRIEAESKPGLGTTIRVTLPVAAPRIGPAAGAIPAVRDQLRGRILVIDDEPLMLDLFRRILSAHDVTCLDDATAALELIDRGEPFDLVLCDLRMPVMSGMELYEKVLARDPELAARFVFVTGDAAGSALEDFLRSVPNRTIAKPFEVSVLWKTVDELLRTRAPAPSSPRQAGG